MTPGAWIALCVVAFIAGRLSKRAGPTPYWLRSRFDRDLSHLPVLHRRHR